MAAKDSPQIEFLGWSKPEGKSVYRGCVAMRFIFHESKTYRFLSILFFFESGGLSVYFFYQVPGLPFFQGIDEEALRTIVSLAWMKIFPAWFAFYFAAMALLGTFLRRINS